jgi:hypothetical protein
MHSYIIYRKEMALKMTMNVLGSFILLLASIYVFKSNILAMIFGLIMISPLLFLNSIMKLFRREVFIDLQNRSVSMTIKKEGDENEMTSEYFFSEIRSYNIQIANRRFASIKLNFKNDKSLEYSFLKEKVVNDQIATRM